MSGPPLRIYTEEQAVAAMHRIAKRWPKSLWLYSASGTLCVMKCKTDGSPAMTAHGGADPDYSIATVKIPNDGGDW